MTPQTEKSCEEVVEKLTQGGKLDEADKLHLAYCEACMDAWILLLDKPKKTGSHNGNGRAAPSPEALRALERGRAVWKREFGITLSTKFPAPPNGEARAPDEKA